MAKFKPVKIRPKETSEEKWAISNKGKTYLPSLGIFDTKTEAAYEAAKANVSYFEDMSREYFEYACKLAEKLGHEVDEYGSGIKEKDADYWTNKGDLCC